MTLDECDRLIANVRAATSMPQTCHALEAIFSKYRVLSVKLGVGSIYWRARIAESNPWPNIASMGYPPASVAQVGRLNDSGSPCVYASLREETAIAEVGAAVGDLVQIAGFRVRHEESVQVALVGDWHHVMKRGYLSTFGSDPDGSVRRQLNGLPLDRAFALAYLDAFLVSLLADENAQKSGYLLSRAVASMIYRDSAIEGIMFPSVRDQFGLNLALKPPAFDSRCYAFRCYYARVRQLREFGFVETDDLQDVEQELPGGDLVWLRADKVIKRTFNLTREEYEAGLQYADDPSNQLNAVLKAHRKSQGQRQEQDNNP